MCVNAVISPAIKVELTDVGIDLKSLFMAVAPKTVSGYVHAFALSGARLMNYWLLSRVTGLFRGSNSLCYRCTNLRCV